MRTLGHREGNNTHWARLGAGEEGIGGTVEGAGRMGRDNTGKNA